MTKFILLAGLALSIAGCSGYPSGTLVFITNERAGTISVIDAATDKVELAAWTSVCRVILNLHETITRY